MIGAWLMVDFAAEHGVTATACLAGTGLDTGALDEAGLDIAAWQELTVARNVVAAVGDSAGLGLTLGQRYHVTAYGAAVGAAILASPTLRAAQQVAYRYRHLTFQVCRIGVERVAGATAFTYDARAVPPDVRRFLLERDVGATLTGARDIAGASLTWRAAEFDFAAPADPGVYRQTFGAPVRFGAPRTRLVLDDELLDRPAPQANPIALRLAERECRALIGRRPAHGRVAAQVLTRLRAAGRAVPGIEEVSSSMLITSRTLRRQLAAEGASFRGLVDQVRREVATDLLAAGELTIEQVAAEVGYTEPSTFTHAFKRWTGMTPRTYRARAAPRS